MNLRNVFICHVMALGLVSLFGASVSYARVAPPTAKSFLMAIYQAYLGNSSQAKGILLDDPNAIRRYFSPGLASLILEDGSTPPQTGGRIVLGNDPFVGRESWDIANLSVEVKETGTKAIGTVSFTNFGKPEKVVVELLKVGADWRIAEIKWGPLTLRSIYRRKWQAALEENPLRN